MLDLGRLKRGAALGALTLGLLVAGCDSAEERAQDHLSQGHALLADGDPVKAALEFRNAAQLDATLADPHLQLGLILLGRGDFALAAGHFRRATELDPEMIEAHVKFGEILLAANELEEARKAAVAAHDLAPEDPSVLVLRAFTEMRLGNLETALESAEAARRNAEDAPEPILALAAIAREQGDLEGALQATEAAIADHPTNLALGLLRVELLGALNRIDEIGPAIDGLIENHPDQLALRRAMARWALIRGDHERTEAELREIAKRAPDNPEAALDVARFLVRVEGRDAAAAELEARIAADPPERVALQLNRAMAEIEIADGDTAAAIDRFRGIVERIEMSEMGAEARITLARLLLREADIDGAQDLVNAVLTYDERHADALTLRARYWLADGNFGSAVIDLRAALNEKPGDLEALELLALAHQRNGSYDLARERLAEAVEVAEFAAPQVLAHARYLAGRGRPEQADAALVRALEERPDDPALLAALASLRIEREDWTGAESIADRMREIDGNQRRSDRVLAASAFGQERFDETIAILKRQAEGTGGADETGLAALVASYARAGRTYEAQAFLETLIEENPGNDSAASLLGRIALERNDPEAAEAWFRRAIEIAPDTAQHYSTLSDMLLAEAKQDAARTVLDDGIAATKDDRLRLALALLLERQGDIDGAIAQYELLHKSQPASDVVANNLVSLISDNDPSAADIDRAYAIAESLRDSELPHVKDTYGWLLHLKGDNDRALAEISAAVEGLPDNPIVHYHHGTVLEALGRTAEARQAFERAIALGEGRALPQVARAKEALEALGSE